VERRTGFAKSQTALNYALVQDAPGGPTTAREIHKMDRWNRHMTALIRSRFYQEKKRQAEKAQNNGR